MQVPEGFDRGIPIELQMAMDETPLNYFPHQRGTYVQGRTRQIFVRCSDEKRQITIIGISQHLSIAIGPPLLCSAAADTWSCSN